MLYTLQRYHTFVRPSRAKCHFLSLFTRFLVRFSLSAVDKRYFCSYPTRGPRLRHVASHSADAGYGPPLFPILEALWAHRRPLTRESLPLLPSHSISVIIAARRCRSASSARTAVLRDVYYAATMRMQFRGHFDATISPQRAFRLITFAHEWINDQGSLDRRLSYMAKGCFRARSLHLCRVRENEVLY